MILRKNTAAFIDLCKILGKMWIGLYNKIKQNFRVRVNAEYTEMKRSKSGIPHRSVLGPLLYLIYTTNDFPPGPIESVTLKNSNTWECILINNLHDVNTFY